MAEADRRRIRLWATEGGRPVGSGVLIAGRIVLTSADACQANDSPTVERPGSDRRYGTRRLWPADRSESTAALLEITDNEWTDLDSAIRCGVIASGDQWIKSMIDGERVAAIEINNLATLPDGCWESRSSATEGGSGVHFGELLTGSAVYSGHTLVGVHVQPVELRDRPLVMPIVGLLADAGFRAMVERAADGPVRLEAADFAGIIRPWLPEAERTRPAALLLAEFEAVPFRARELLSHDIRQWCAEPQSRSGAVLVGPAGAGKRRLARTVADMLRDQGWAAGELAGRQTDGWLETITRSRLPVFLIVDEAARRGWAIAELARQLMTVPGAKMRVLLLAPDLGPWWTEALRSDPAVRAVFGERVHQIGPLATDPASMAERLEEARISFAATLSVVAQPWILGADASPSTGSRRYDPAAEDSGNALRLHMAALAAVLTGVPDDQRSAVGVVLDNEQRHWQQAASSLPIEARSSWRPALATAMLFGAPTEAVAVQTLRITPALKGATDPVLQALAEWVRLLYPPQEDGHFWGTLRPELVLIEHVVQSWSEPSLLDAMLPSVDPDQAQHALSLLLDSGDAALLSRVGQLVAAHLRKLGPELVDLAYAHPAALELAEQIVDDEDSDLSDEVCSTMLERVPPVVGPLTVVATRLHERLIQSYATAVEEGSDRVRATLAAHLSALAVLQADSGPSGEAADLGARAVEQYQWLVTSGGNRSAYVTSLAESHRLHARLLAQAGRPDAAVEAARQAADIYRQFVGLADPAARPELAAALTGQADYAVMAGDRPMAIAVLREAAGVLNAVVDDEPSVTARLDGLSQLVDTLGRLAEILEADAQPTPALAAREEAVRAAQRMHASDPARSRPLLIDCLAAVADTQLRLARSDAAVATMRQTLRWWRQEAEEVPAPGLAGLASVAMAVSARLSEVGYAEPAVDAATEAVEAMERLDRIEPGSVVADLALAQHTLSLRLAEAGHWKDAADLADQALSAYSRVIHEGRSDLTPDYAAALVNRAAISATAGRHEDAAQAAQQAMALLSGPDGPQHNSSTNRLLAAALTNAAVAFGRLGRRHECLSLARQAVSVRQEDIPPAERVRALSLLRDTLLAEGRPQDAVQAAVQAVALYNEIGPREPEVYKAPYAVSLHEAARCFAAARMWEHGIQYCTSAMKAYEAARTRRQRWLAERTDLAMLHCVCYAEMGLSAEAAAAAQRAVALHEEGTEDGTSRDPAQLADTLDAVSTLPAAALGPSAVAYAQQAVEHRRRVAATGDPGEILKLVRALRRLAARQAEAGGPERALPAARESVAQSRRLKEYTGIEATEEVASCLRELSEYLADSGHVADSLEAAADAAREAAEEYRILAADDPIGYLPRYAAALLDLSHRQLQIGSAVDALLSAQSAVAALDRVQSATPRDRAMLGQALVQLGLCLGEAKSADVAQRLELAQRAVDLYAQLSAEDSQFQADLAVALRAFAEVRAGKVSLERRRQAAQQAVEIHRGLADRDSAGYQAELMASQQTLSTLRSRRA